MIDQVLHCRLAFYANALILFLSCLVTYQSINFYQTHLDLLPEYQVFPGQVQESYYVSLPCPHHHFQSKSSPLTPVNTSIANADDSTSTSTCYAWAWRVDLVGQESQNAEHSAPSRYNYTGYYDNLAHLKEQYQYRYQMNTTYECWVSQERNEFFAWDITHLDRERVQYEFLILQAWMIYGLTGGFIVILSTVWLIYHCFCQRTSADIILNNTYGSLGTTSETASRNAFMGGVY